MPDGATDLIDAKDLRFEQAQLRAYYQDKEIVLTETQLKVLQCIHARHPKFVANKDLRKEVWLNEDGDPNVPQQHITALNKVLPRYGLHVHSEREIGYQIRQGANEQKQHHAFRVDSERKSSIETYRDWGEADKIISKATKSLLIIDSYFGQSGDIELLIVDALSVKTTRLKISIYMADPQKHFGAQRFKEKEKPEDRKIPYKQALDRNDNKLLNYYRGKYQRAYDGCISEIIGHLVKPRVKLYIYKYPIMPATRIYVVDNIDYIFGCFPLLAHNPAYTCFHLKKEENLSVADADAVNRLARQVRIIRKISDPVWPRRSRAKVGRRAAQ